VTARQAALRVHHGPVAVAAAHEQLSIEASIQHPHLVRRALLVYVRQGAAPQEVEFRRSVSGGYVAEVPSEHVDAPWLAYAIELEALDGQRSSVFASRENPHVVQIPEDSMDMEERALAERLSRRRSVFAAMAEYVSFGKSEAQVFDAATGRFEQEQVADNYYRLEGSYTYRPLRLVAEFSLRAGIVRGKSPVPLELRDDQDQSESDRFDVGLNYGAPTVRLRVADFVHLEAELLISVTEVGFSSGAGGAILVGDPYGDKLVLGFEAIQVFGTRIYSRLDIRATDRVMLSPMVEATNMPHANMFGVRLLGEVAVDLGSGFGVAARGGYQARLSTEGGPAMGASLAYAF
jgi:hypothetical protein